MSILPTENNFRLPIHNLLSQFVPESLREEEEYYLIALGTGCVAGTNYPVEIMKKFVQFDKILMGIDLVPFLFSISTGIPVIAEFQDFFWNISQRTPVVPGTVNLQNVIYPMHAYFEAWTAAPLLTTINGNGFYSFPGFATPIGAQMDDIAFPFMKSNAQIGKLIEKGDLHWLNLTPIIGNIPADRELHIKVTIKFLTGNKKV